MKLNDKIQIQGIFKIESYDVNDNIIDDYELENNLIVNSARTNMAELVAGVTSNSSPINKIILGTRGHVGSNILDNILVGETDATLGTFDADRTELFSETLNDNNYRITFDPTGGVNVTDSAAPGTMYTGSTAGTTDSSFNTVNRYVSGDNGNIVTYAVTIPIDCGNLTGSAIAYTEAGLYADDELFAMKTFSARVKEETVKLVITWSIVF